MLTTVPGYVTTRCKMALRKTSTILRIGHAFSLRGMLVMVALSDLAWGLN
jgi:hypothetical protein